jgi:hypothetical protein
MLINNLFLASGCSDAARPFKGEAADLVFFKVCAVSVCQHTLMLRYV